VCVCERESESYVIHYKGLIIKVFVCVKLTGQVELCE